MNSTVFPDQWVPLIAVGTRDIIVGLFFSLLAVITLICNVFVLLVLHRGRNRFDEVMRILIQMLAMTDLVGGVSCCILQALHHTLRQFANSVMICKLVPFATVYLVLQSLYIVCLINLYRLLSVARPLTQVRYLTPKKVRICVVIVKIAVFGFVLPLLPVNCMPVSRALDSYCDVRRNDQRALWIPPADMIPGMAGAVAATIIAFAIPLLTLTVTNARLLMIACQVVRRNANVKRSQTQYTDRKKTTNLESVNSERNQQNNRPDTNQLNPHPASGFKGLKTVIVVTGLFYISCIPFCILFATALNNRNMFENGIVCIFFLLSNAWWNGPIFMYTSRTFRKEAIKLKNDMKRWLKEKCIGVGNE